MGLPVEANGEQDITLLAYTALQVEARRPGTVPRELLETLSERISGTRLTSDCIPHLASESIEYLEEVEALLERESDLERLIAYSRVGRLAENESITPDDIEKTRVQIEQDVDTFNNLIDGKGGDGYGNIPAVA